MKSLTIRLPDVLAFQIERESQVRRVSKSDVVRERLSQPRPPLGRRGSMAGLAGDLIGATKGLPSDLSALKKKYLPDVIRAKKLHRR
jgi:hypothetical protein